MLPEFLAMQPKKVLLLFAANEPMQLRWSQRQFTKHTDARPRRLRELESWEPVKEIPSYYTLRKVWNSFGCPFNILPYVEGTREQAFLLCMHDICFPV